MKQISKKEALWLDKNGYNFGERVFATKRKYYCTEDQKVQAALTKFRAELAGGSGGNDGNG